MENQNPSERKPLRPFSCNVPGCDETFQAHKDLLAHLRYHRANKQYRCYDLSCRKVFSSQSCLKKHERIHNGEKPYRCDICHQSFTQVSNLRRHERVHKGEKPYECNICHKKFSTSSNHKQHMLVHQEKDDRMKFWCEKCNTSYYYKASLKKHLKTHQDENNNVESESSTVVKSEEDVAPVTSKKIFISPVTNIVIPDISNQEMLQEKKRQELVAYWEQNSYEYLKANPFLMGAFAFPQLFSCTPQLFDSKMHAENPAKLDYSESKESSDTLSHTSKTDKLNKTMTYESHSNNSDLEITPLHSSFGAGIRIPIPIRPKKC